MKISNSIHCVHFKSVLDKEQIQEKILSRDLESAQSCHFHNTIKPSILSKKEKDKEQAMAHVKKATKLDGQALGDIVDVLVKNIQALRPTKNIFSKILEKWKEDDTNDFMGSPGSNQGGKEYIKYGCLSSSSHVGLQDYGNVSVFFYDNVKENMTFTPGYTLKLKEQIINCPFAVTGNEYPIVANMNLNYSSRESVLNCKRKTIENFRIENFRYGGEVEWQFYGQLPFDYIECICFTPDTPKDHLEQAKVVFKTLKR